MTSPAVARQEKPPSCNWFLCLDRCGGPNLRHTSTFLFRSCKSETDKQAPFALQIRDRTGVTPDRLLAEVPRTDILGEVVFR
jgi:hypothetical protein